jgi:hypothetical protein
MRILRLLWCMVGACQHVPPEGRIDREGYITSGGPAGFSAKPATGVDGVADLPSRRGEDDADNWRE